MGVEPAFPAWDAHRGDSTSSLVGRNPGIAEIHRVLMTTDRALLRARIAREGAPWSPPPFGG